MVDAQAVDQAFGIEPKNRRMNRFEYLVIFDADGGKLIDVEEAPPVDFVIGRAPPHQPVMLAFEQFDADAPVRSADAGSKSSSNDLLQRQRRFAVASETVIEIADENMSVLPVQGDFASSERLAVSAGRGSAGRSCHADVGCPASNRCQNILQSGSSLSVRQNIHPPRIVAADRHMVRNDVDD